MDEDPRIEAAAKAANETCNRIFPGARMDRETALEVARAALAAADASERDNLNSAPRDGTPIKARIADWYTVAWQGGFEDPDSREIGAWVCLDPNHPPSWTDGVCWVNNENNELSAPILQARYTLQQEQE